MDKNKINNTGLEFLNHDANSRVMGSMLESVCQMHPCKSSKMFSFFGEGNTFKIVPVLFIHVIILGYFKSHFLSLKCLCIFARLKVDGK